jgi:hypothetical protein
MIESNTGMKSVYESTCECGVVELRAQPKPKITCFQCRKIKKGKYYKDWKNKIGKHKLICQWCKSPVYRKLKWKKPMTCKDCANRIKIDNKRLHRSIAKIQLIPNSKLDQ